jgi:hypothetical protein
VLCKEIEVKEVHMTQVSSHPFHDLALECVGALCTCTRDAPTEAAHWEALQAFCNALFPWVDPSDVPHPPPAVFPLWQAYHIDQHGVTWIILTQEGLALFRAWLRSRQETVHEAEGRERVMALLDGREWREQHLGLGIKPQASMDRDRAHLGLQS